MGLGGNTMSPVRRLLAIVAFAMLASCGGGGGGSSGGGGAVVISNRAPTAVAGPAQAGTTGAVVSLNGGASSDPDGGAITYQWVMTAKPAGSEATLTGATTATPSFRPDVSGGYLIQLVVSDGSLSSTASETGVTAGLLPADATASAAARLSAAVDIAQAKVDLTWTDAFPSATSYRVDLKEGAATSYSTLATLAGTGGSMAYTRAFTGSASFRIVALTSGREIPVLTTGGQSTLSVDPPANPQIVVSQAGTISNSATLSVDPEPTGSTVKWYSDLAPIGTGHPFNWDSSTVANGNHQLLAQLDYGNGTLVNLVKAIQTNNVILALSSSFSGTGSGSNVTWRLLAQASAPIGIANVRVAVDGGAPQTLTAPNGCPSSCTTFTHYVFTYTALGLGSGAHSFVITATDTVGGSKQATQSLTITLPATIAITSPQPGEFLTGSLNLQGSWSTTPGAAAKTTRAWLGSVQFLNTTADPFSGTTSLTGLAAGAYLLQVNVSGTPGGENNTTTFPIIVPSGPSTTPQLMFTVPGGGSILSVEGDLVLYRRNSDAKVFVRNVTSGANVELQSTGGPAYGDYVIGPDGIYAVAGNNTGACGCVFRWSVTTGVPTNVTALASIPSGITPSQTLRTHGNTVMWLNSDKSFTSYNSSTATFLSTPVLAPTSDSTIPYFDFAVVSGALNIVYWERIQTPNPFLSAPLVPPATYKLTRWTAAGGASVLSSETVTFNHGGLGLEDVRTDGVSVLATLRSNSSISLDGLQVRVLPLAGGAGASASGSRTASRARLANGVASFYDGSIQKVWSPAQVAGFVSLPNSTSTYSDRDVGGGVAIYHSNGQNLAWNGATGASLLRYHGGPFVNFISGTFVYFMSGELVYRISLS